MANAIYLSSMEWHHKLTDPLFQKLVREIGLDARRMDESIEFGRDMCFQASRYVPSRVLYITRLTGFLGLELDHAFDRVSVFSRSGMVTPAHAALIACEAQRQKRDVSFVGDLDPWDLMVFVTLTMEMRKHGVDVDYVGIDSNWLELCNANGKQLVQESFHLIDLGPFELEFFKRLQELPVQWDQVMGRPAFDLLQNGTKLELEGATNPSFYTRAHRRGVQEILLGTKGKSNGSGRRTAK